MTMLFDVNYAKTLNYNMCHGCLWTTLTDCLSNFQAFFLFFILLILCVIPCRKLSWHWRFISFWTHSRIFSLYCTTSVWSQMPLTRQPRRRSDTALRPILAAAIMSSWWPELPAATAFAVASVNGRVRRTSSSGVIFCSKRSADFNAYSTNIDF